MNPQEPGQSDEKYFQALMDNIAARGISTSLPENQISIMQFRAMNTQRYSAQADASGRFTIKDVAPGQYTLEADQLGFFDIPGRQALANVDVAKPINVSVGLLAGGTITGRVQNAAGKLLPNATVTAYQITYLNGKIIPEAQSSQATDDRGEYRMFWLPRETMLFLRILRLIPSCPIRVTPRRPAGREAVPSRLKVPCRHRNSCGPSIRGR